MNIAALRVGLIALLLVSFLPQKAWGVDCGTPDISLTSQAQVDSFQVDYGVKGENCTTVTGNLSIEGDDISNINGLADITDVGGGLTIQNNTILANVSGLANLAGVMGDFLITDNPLLTSLGGLGDLLSVGGFLNISQNDTLADLDSVSNLTSVGGYLEIADNPLMITLGGLSDLASVGGYLRISQNQALTSLNGLPNLSSVVGFLEFKDNISLLSLNGMNNLLGVGEYFELFDNLSLASINGLANLTTIGGSFQLINNPDLASINGLTNLLSVGGTLNIEDNHVLNNLDGLNNVTSIAGDLLINSNGALIDIDSLSNLTSLNGNCSIRSNTMLTNLDGLGDVGSVSGDLEIFDNPALANLNGLANLISVGGALVIESNAMLDSTDGFANLVSVGGDFGIKDNAVLTGTNGLTNLGSVGGSLQINDNDLLNNLDDLKNLISVGIDVELKSNPKLQRCSALQTLLDGLDDGLPGPAPLPTPIPDVGGLVIIDANLPTCNSVESILSTFAIGGTVSGLAGTGLVLQNNKTINLSIESNGDFNFATPVDGGSAYMITVLTQPANLSQECLITNNNGSVTDENISNIVVSCTTSTFTVGGNVSSLVGQGLVLQNNEGDDLAIGADGAFSLTPQLDGSPYDVSIRTQPSSPVQTCNVFNGSGSLSGADVLDVVVTCADCSATSITLSSQADVDNFQADYGGESSCDRVVDSLLISDGLDITNLDGLRTLERVGGWVTISSNPLLTNLDGLGKLVSVGGGVSVLGSATSADKAGQSTGQNEPDSLTITNNSILSNLDGLAKLIRVGSNLAVDNNPLLSRCSALKPLLDDIDDALPGPGPGPSNIPDVGENVDFHNNLPTCNGVTDILTTFPIGGLLAGLNPGETVTLQNNDGDDLMITSEGRFTFATPLPNDAPYSVSVISPPPCPTTTCTISNGAGNVSGAEVTNIQIRLKDEIFDDDFETVQ